MSFDKKCKIRPWYIDPFKVLESVESVVYRLGLSPNLSRVNPIAHVFMLKKYHGDGKYIIKWDSILL